MRMISFAYGAALAMAASLGLGGSASINMDAPRIAILPQRPTISKPAKKLRTTTKHPRNGQREVARRLRQIAAGQLTRSNGLATAAELYRYRRAA